MSVAGILLRKGLSYDEIYSTLSNMNSSQANPLPESEILTISQSVCNYERTVEDFTHTSFAKMLINKLDGSVMYVRNFGFYLFNGKYWEFDDENLQITHSAIRLASEVTTRIENQKTHLEPKEYNRLKAAANKLKNAGFIRSSFDLVKAEPEIRSTFNIFESNRSLLNFENGTFDLDAMVFRDFAREDYLKAALDLKYDQKADCPRFKQFLNELFEPEIAAFVIRVLGYALLGLANEQRLFILYGHGRNGKSVLVDVITKILGDFCVTIQPESLTGKMDGSIRSDLVKLAGARVMLTSETRAGTVLDSALIKQITGQDIISARKLFKEHIEFTPQCVPFLVTNHLPVIDGADFAMARRMCLIPFERTIVEPDRGLPKKLSEERAGILNLLLEGVCSYKANGLQIPESIQAATAKYVSKSNLLKGFVDDCLSIVEGEKVQASTLYHYYRCWAERSGYKPLSMGIFKEMMERELGHEQRRAQEGKFWINVKLKPNV